MKKTIGLTLLAITLQGAALPSKAFDFLNPEFIAWIATQATEKIDRYNSGMNYGNYKTYSEQPLNKALEQNSIVATEAEKAMLLSGPVYITKEGLKPVGNNHPYRLTQDGYSTDMLYLITTKLDEDILKQIAQHSIKAHGVLVMRGLVNNSVEDTVKAVTPLLNMGAIIKVDPRIEDRFGHNFRGKAPQFVNTLVRKDGSYGCDGDTAQNKCFGYVSVSGIRRTFSNGLEVESTIKTLMFPDEYSSKNPETKAYNAITHRRFD